MNFKNTQARELLENRRWFQGAEDRLEYFFKKEYWGFERPVEEAFNLIAQQNRFWVTVGGKIPRVHSGLPKLITKTKVNLITANGFDVDSDEEVVKRLWAILDFNEFTKVWQGVETETSWAGRGLFRIYHELGDKVPRLEKVEPSGFEIITQRGKVVGIIYTSVKDDLEIQETLRLKNNKVSVEYKAFKLEQGKEKYEVALPQELKDFVNEFPFTFLPFELVNNTIGNSRFPESPYGESDYTAVQSLFHALDSLLSHGQLEVNSARAIKLINEKILKLDDDGTGIYDDNETVIKVSSTDMEKFDIKKHIDLFQPNIRVAEYDKLASDLKAQILAIAGISPVSTGLAGFERVDASADSQREREKASLRTRDFALAIRKTIFESLFVKLLQYEDYLNERTLGEYELTVEFSEWSVPTLDDKVDTITKALQAGAIDVLTAVQEMFPNKDEEEIGRIVFNIKLEQGIPLFREDYQRVGLVPPNVEFTQEVE